MKTAEEKKINLYISCSTKSGVLTEQKTTIINLCRKLNEYYAEKGFCVRINPVGYDDRESRDDVFEKFTVHTADIVVFLVDKECKDDEQKRLERELEYVCSSYKEYRRPEVLVYMPDDVNKSLKADIHNKLIINGLSSITIKNTETLESDVKENIEKYIKSYNVLHEIHKKAEIRHYFKGIMFIAIVLLFFLVWMGIEYYNASQPRLLIAGGGSAKTLIEQMYMKNKEIDDTKKFPFWVYAPLPSISGYRLLIEETAMDVKNQDFHKRNYYTVILSAKKASDDYFLQYEKNDNIAKKRDSILKAIENLSPEKRNRILKTNYFVEIMDNRKKKAIQSFKKTGMVIGIFMGWDSLVVYSKGIDLPNSITKDSLCDLIDSNINIIYTTNAFSGTLRQYNEFYRESDKSDTTKKIRPNEDRIYYSMDTINDTIKKWIALGSQYYAPPNNNKTTSIVDNAEPKPVYVYFMKYRNTKYGEDKEVKYVLPKATKKFLKEIGISTEVIKKIEACRMEDTTTILFDHFCADKKYNNPNHTHVNK